MNTKETLSRITIDIPIESHKRLKVMATLLGKSMREIVVESIEERLNKYPNKETLKTIKDIENKKGLVEAVDAADLFKKLGI